MKTQDSKLPSDSLIATLEYTKNVLTSYCSKFPFVIDFTLAMDADVIVGSIDEFLANYNYFKDKGVK